MNGSPVQKEDQDRNYSRYLFANLIDDVRANIFWQTGSGRFAYLSQGKTAGGLPQEVVTWKKLGYL